MIHLGDITKLNGYEIPIVDCITGGSPCQDLSVAGNRAGLAGERSGLFMDQIRIVKEMREHDRSNGRAGEFVRPRFLVWENVPGAFSSNKGKDFQAVLTEIIKIAEADAPDVPMPEKGRWNKSGCLYDEMGRWSVAWRVHDAQFWGVPQRRKRIALVADFGGLSAPEICFVRKGMSGDIEKSGEAGEGTAGTVEGGTDYTIPINTMVGTRTTKEKRTTFGIGEPGDPQFTISSAHEHAVFCLNDQGGSEPIMIEMTSTKNTIVKDGTSPTLTARMGTGGNQVNAVLSEGTSGTTQKIFSRQRSDEFIENSVSSTQSARQHKDATDLVVTAVDCRNGTENELINGTLQAKSTGGICVNFQNVCRQANTVRRLTPLECERLQGFPDNWTDIGAWTDTKGKVHKESSDSARYKALGNSIALPFWFWLLRRISAQYERPATMGSLFDGIGGFPYCWEKCNGKGTAIWASEIEEFPMAVTKKHFGEEDNNVRNNR